MIEVQGWPEDPQWVQQASTAVRTALPALESLIGLPVPGSGTVAIREVTEADLGGDYAGSYDADTDVAWVSEDLDETTVAHELSHVWFNSRLFSDRWLTEGYASYAEKTAAANDYQACKRPEVYTGSGQPPALNTWKVLGPRATADDRDAVSYQYAASCWIVTAVADAIGDARFTQVLQAASRHEIAYAGAGAPETVGSGAVDWRTWLDLVDERGMVAAGRTDLDYVQRLLADFGVPRSSSELDARSSARAQYHALAAQAGDWALPYAVRGPMAAWQFTQATSAMEAATPILDLRARLVALAPDAASVTTLQTKFESAQDASELRAAVDYAQDRLAAATTVTAAVSRARATHGAVETVGLLGTDLRAMTADAETSLAKDQVERAVAVSAEIDQAVNGASATGQLRLGLGLGAGLLCLLGGVLVIRRRGGLRLRPAPAAEPTPVSLEMGTTDGPVTPGVDAADPLALPVPPPQAPVLPDRPAVRADELAMEGAEQPGPGPVDMSPGEAERRAE